MRILYISQCDLVLSNKGIYSDLIDKLCASGHDVILCCADSKYKKTSLIDDNALKKLEIKVPNQFGVNFIKKGLIILSLENIIKKNIKKFLKKESFDLVIYATPPITFAGAIKYCKKQYNCKSYLMLKDIFPQNAVDLHMISKTGLSGILYKIFRKKESALYKVSDKIGCMSNANINYVLEHNSYIDENKVELFPNAINCVDKIEKDKSILEKIGLDKDKLTFIYGGNLGKPQGLDFLSNAIKACESIENIQFVMIGSGSEKTRFFDSLESVSNCKCLERLPHDDYEKLCASCDVGIIALDYRFTIPNYPSRILSYMNNAMPVLACTDKVTDIKELVEEQANCGKWCYSNDINGFVQCVKWFAENQEKLQELGHNSLEYMINNFNTDICVEKLENFMQLESEKV